MEASTTVNPKVKVDYTCMCMCWLYSRVILAPGNLIAWLDVKELPGGLLNSERRFWIASLDGLTQRSTCLKLTEAMSFSAMMTSGP